MASRISLEAIRKKLVGKRLNEREIRAVIEDLVNEELKDICLAYFLAAGFSHGFSNEETYFIIKAMVETGERLSFKGVVADKHSTGGVAGTRTTMILVPIVASCGFKVPKNSSRAITSPAGTADVMEVLAPVTFSAERIEKIVNEVGGCVVWGGSLNIAPADEKMIRVERPLNFESFDNIIFSVMAKKIASGATHLVIDIPVGPTMKIRHFKDAEMISKKFNYIASRFGIKLAVDVNHTFEPAGNGAGPVLEARDVLAVLERRKGRPMMLEKKALRLTGKLLDLCFGEKRGGFKKIRKRYKELGENGERLAKEILDSGVALDKMREIIKAQGGNDQVRMDDLKVAGHVLEVKSSKRGEVVEINNKILTEVCRSLGSPEDKKAGIYLEKRIGDRVRKNETLFKMYSDFKERLSKTVERGLDVVLFRID